MEDKKNTAVKAEFATFDETDQAILLGRWALGDFKDNMKNLPKKLFKRQEVYEAIEQGLDLVEMATKKIINYSEVATLTEYNTGDSFYNTAYKKGLNHKLNLLQNKYLDLCGKDEKTAERLRLIKAIEETKGLIDEKQTVEEIKDFENIFINELDRRASEQSARYGIEDLDRATGGIHRGQLIVIGARPATGKSAFTLQIADFVRQRNKKVLYLPLEMTAFETFERLLVREGIITQEETKSGRLTDEQKEQAKAYLKELEDGKNFILCEGLKHIDEIKQTIRKKQPYLVIIDQLTQVKTSGKYNQLREKYKEITNTLKDIALQENVSIILVSQLNRESVDKGRGTLESLAESDSIGQDADVVLTLTAENKDDNQDRRFKEIYLDIVKQREYGQCGKRITLIFEGAKYCFKNAQRDSDKAKVEGFRLIQDVDF